MRLRLVHRSGAYNAVRRLMYLLVILAAMLAVASGLMLWKLVQLDAVLYPLGGYEVMRRVHFVAMAGIMGFVVVHLALVLMVPRTLPAMITGLAVGEAE